MDSPHPRGLYQKPEKKRNHRTRASQNNAHSHSFSKSHRKSRTIQSQTPRCLNLHRPQQLRLPGPSQSPDILACKYSKSASSAESYLVPIKDEIEEIYPPSLARTISVRGGRVGGHRWRVDIKRKLATVAGWASGTTSGAVSDFCFALTIGSRPMVRDAVVWVDGGLSS